MMNLSGLAYVVAESTDLARWKSYAEEVLGMMTTAAPEGGLYLRMDERQFRFAIEPGKRDRYVASAHRHEVSDFVVGLLIERQTFLCVGKLRCFVQESRQLRIFVAKLVARTLTEV